MTNEEKAYEILKSVVKHNQSLEYYQQQGPYAAAMQMAQWKDEQFYEEKKELLGLVNMFSVDEHNQTIIEDLKALLQ